MQNKKPKIIFVLSSGSARGLAHLGVLEVLEEANIKPDAIIGSSMGALIGGLYAAGIDLEKIEKTSLNIGKLQKILLFASLPQRNGLVGGGRIEKLIKEFIGEKDIKDLKIPFYAATTDLIRGKEMVINKGSLIRAIKASSAIPGVFRPVKLENKVLVDGGVVDPLPIEIASKLGADVIIASDVNSFRKRIRISSSSSIITILRRSLDIITDLHLKDTLAKSDNKTIIIKSQLQSIGWMDYSRAEKIIKIGRKAAQEKLKEIKKIIKQFC